MKQQTFSMTGYFDKGKKTRREIFLGEMEATMPWSRLCALIEPHYPKGSPAGGRPPLPLERMFRIYCLQQWYNLSDPGAEEALYDSITMRGFAGVSTDEDVIPDETSILNFRRLLEKHKLTERLLTEINTHLAERGLLVGKGTIVDATIINAPSSTKNEKKKRDPQMHQTRKGKQWYFGMKIHTGTDADSGLVHTVKGTAANVADVNVLGELLHGGEDSLHGDSAYHSKALKAQAEANGLEFNVNQRGTKSRPLTKAQRLRNRRLSRIRAVVEHPFLVVKRLWGHAKVRYRGIAKNLAQMNTLFALANLYRVRYRLLSP
ncbi:MAG: transposase [Betaproteobacteria bacterium RIFCSPLOWO2_12_FULL_67_28]|nr:MAG: transposase [Betaproteobacteria bacterium RIFCSPLOWO2_12_FULL_67_28]